MPIYSNYKRDLQQKLRVCVGGLVDMAKVCKRTPQNIRGNGTYVVSLKEFNLIDIKTDDFLFDKNASPQKFVLARFNLGS